MSSWLVHAVMRDVNLHNATGEGTNRRTVDAALRANAAATQRRCVTPATPRRCRKTRPTHRGAELADREGNMRPTGIALVGRRDMAIEKSASMAKSAANARGASVLAHCAW
jgi:hypothetical protein